MSDDYKPKNGYIFYDYETFGANAEELMPAQFGAVITDRELNIVEKVQFYCKPRDYDIPSPISVLVTGIVPQVCLEKGFREPEFAARVNQVLSRSGYCVVGYNNFEFDDDVTRFLLYRNFEPPYLWHLESNQNFRQDVMSVMRLILALRPEFLNWFYKTNDEGNQRVSLKLTDITQCNHISHEHAHEALSDALATLELFKLIQKNAPKLFNFILKINRPSDYAKYFKTVTKSEKPMVNFSPFYGLDKHYCAVVYPIFEDSKSCVVCDLSVDLDSWINLSPEEIKEQLYMKKGALNQLNLQRPPLQLMRFNRAPLLLQGDLLREQDVKRLGLDLEKINAQLVRVKELVKTYDFKQKMKKVFVKSYGKNKEVTCDNVATALYDINIFHSDFASLGGELRRMCANEKGDFSRLRGYSKDGLINLLFDYYLYQNNPEYLPPENLAKFEQMMSQRFAVQWDAFCLEMEQAFAPDSPYEITPEQREHLKLTYEYVTQLKHYSTLAEDKKNQPCFSQLIN